MEHRTKTICKKQNNKNTKLKFCILQSSSKVKEDFFRLTKIVGIMASRPDPKEMLKEVLQREAKWYTWETQIYISRERVLEKELMNKKNVALLFLIDLTDR